MKELLNDVVRQVAPLFEKVKVTGHDTGTKIEAHTDDKMLFLVANLDDVIPDFAGEFGISNPALLRDLLEFAPYKADIAKLHVRRSVRDDLNYASELEFMDGAGGRAGFKTINPRMIGDQAKIAEIPWSVSVSPSKSKLTEVMQLTAMLAQVDQHFAVSYEDRTLSLMIGGKGTTNHNATVVLATDIDGEPLPAKMVFKAPAFVGVLKKVGNWPCTIRFCTEGLGGVLIETDHGTYNYILRSTEG